MPGGWQLSPSIQSVVSIILIAGRGSMLGTTLERDAKDAACGHTSDARASCCQISLTQTAEGSLKTFKNGPPFFEPMGSGLIIRVDTGDTVGTS